MHKRALTQALLRVASKYPLIRAFLIRARPVWQEWREWHRYRYVSTFECWLNRGLWMLLGVAVVYAAAQHVVLINRPEVFSGGARIGEVLYDLAIGYTGAFIFYLLIVRIPLRRDRRNVYRHIALLMNRVVAEASNLVGSLFSAAGYVPDEHETTWENIQDACWKIGPDSEGELVGAQPARKLNIVDCMRHYMDRARSVNRQIVELAPYLATEVISTITDIEQNNYFRLVEDMHAAHHGGGIGNKTFEFLAYPLFDYLLVVHRFDNYRRKYMPINFAGTQYLVERKQGEIPLPLPRNPNIER